MKQVRETSAGQHISAYIVLNKKGLMVAKVHVYYGNAVSVDVWGWDGKTPDLQQKRAGGYGYDKFTSALNGVVIDGQRLFDHCGTDKKTKNLLKQYLDGKYTEDIAREKAKKIGARFANFNTETGKYSSLYYRGGLDRLNDIGYRVLQAF